jgi:hypothetical protein
MANDAANLRRNVRAQLNVPVVLSGTDREGKPFKVTGQSRDFSRTGLAVVLEQNVLATGSVVTITNDGRFQGIATVQWLRPDAETGFIKAGLRLVQSKTSLGLKIAAGLLLFFAFLSQVSFGQSRDVVRAGPQTTVSQTVGDTDDEDEGNWLEHAVAKAKGAKANERKAVVTIQMSKDTYSAGDTVSASGYRLTNPSKAGQSVELKTWISGPGVSPISVGNQGADGSYVLESGMNEDFGRLDLLPVSNDMLGGKGEIGSRILDPVTGEIVGESIKSFTLATARNSGAPQNNQMPSVSVDLQMKDAVYKSGDTVEVAAYRLMNQGATAATIEAKVWLEAPGMDPIAVYTIGADGGLVLTPGSDMSLRPMESFQVTQNLPSGNYTLKSRVLDPVTGQVYHETASSFRIQN